MGKRLLHTCNTVGGADVQHTLLSEYARWGFDTRGWRPGTRDAYVRRVASYDTWTHITHLECAATADTRLVRGWMSSLSPNPRTRNHSRQALVGFYRFLADIGERDDNPTDGIDALPVPRAIPKACTSKQGAAILGAAAEYGRRWSALVGLLLYAGLRATEARTLQWRHVQDDWLVIDGKGGHQRALPLHPAAKVELDRWQAVCDDGVWVFPSPRDWMDGPMSDGWMRTQVKQVGCDAGVPDLHPHMLRHTSATTLLEQGADVRTVQEFLGHASLQTTTGYLRVRPARIQAAVDALTYNDESPHLL